MKTRWLLTVTAVAVSLSLGLRVLAQEEEPGEPEQPLAPTTVQQAEDGTWLVPLVAVGSPPAIELRGQYAERLLRLPVPEGMQADVMTLMVGVSADVESAYLEVYDGDRAVWAEPIDDAEQPDIEIPLDLAEARDGWLNLRLVSRLRSLDDVCATAVSGGWLQMRDSVLVLSGRMRLPTTVANFLPPALTKLTLVVPPDVSFAEADAALQLAALAARRYAAHGVDVVLQTLANRETLPATTTDSLYERTIVIRELTEGVGDMQVVGEVGMPYLRLQGAPDQLRDQYTFLESEYAALAFAPAVTVQHVDASAPVTARQFSLAALGLGDRLQVTGVGQLEIPFTLSQADLGGPVSAMALRLNGTYTPLGEGALANLLVFVNGALVKSQAVARDATFDLTASVPQELIQRDNAIIVRFDYTPAGHDCSLGLETFTAQINGTSYVQVDRGQTLLAGFQRFPQVLQPGFAVSFEQLDTKGLAGAVEAVSALQAITRAPLAFTVTPWADALAARIPVVLVAPGSQSLTALNPPVLTEPVRVIGSDGKEVMRLDENADFGVMQAFENGGRDLLLLTYRTDADLLTQLMSTLAGDPRGWYALQGDVVLKGVATAPVDLHLRGAQSASSTSGSGLVRYLPVAFGVLVLLVVIVAAIIYVRAVRRRRSA